MPGFVNHVDPQTRAQRIELPDGRSIARVDLIDYIAALVVTGTSKDASEPLFATINLPHGQERHDAPRKSILARLSDNAVVPVVGWSWIITSVAASHAPAVVELRYNGQDYIFSGPYMERGVELENPIVVNEQLRLEGSVDRRRMTPGPLYVWLRGFLARKRV